jgi:hypothetical protein
MMSNLNLKVLVWDEYVERAKQRLLQAGETIRQKFSLQSLAHLVQKVDDFLERTDDGKISRFEIQVLGIRDVKGLEFDDVIILNFFSAEVEYESGKRVWQSIPKSSEKSWKLLMRTEDAATVRRGISDLQIQMQLKMLYTACSRCRCRLIFFESEALNPKADTSVGTVFFRKLCDDLKLISRVEDSSDVTQEVLEGRTRVLDDWAYEAVFHLSASFFIKFRHFLADRFLLQVSIAHSIQDMHDRDRVQAVDQTIQVKLCLQKARPHSNCLELMQCDA